MENEPSGDVPAPIWKIITVAAVAAGIQFGWALQLSLLTPYVQTLGVPHAWSSFIWLCGPLSGLIVQPIVGYNSDRCTSRFGRRRPFITGGAFFVIIAVFLIGFAKDIGHASGDPLEVKATKPRAVACFVVGFWILDVANNMLQGPCRAFLADLSANNHERMRISNGLFSFFMAVGNVLGYAAGSTKNLHNFLPFTKTTACDAYCSNLKTCFLIDIVLLLAITVTAVTLVKETPWSKEVDRKRKGIEGDEDSTKSGLVPFVGELISAFKKLKKPMWILLLVTCLNWIAWFPFLLYDTDWVGREIFGGTADGTDDQNKLYNAGVRAGALGLMINSIVLAFVSLGMEPVGRLLGGVKNLWGGVNFILAIGLALTVLVSKMASHWRADHAAQIFDGPPTNIRAFALGIFGMLGIPLAITYSVPFALASIYCSETGGGQGLSLGVLNIAIVVPQMFVSLVSGRLDAALGGGGNLPAFVMGAIMSAISAALAIVALPNPSGEVSLSPAAGGGH